MATNIQGKDEDETKIHETRGETVPLGIFLQVMNSYGRECIFVIALIFTAIAALQEGPLKTKKANPPRLFFTPPSLVTDFYQGNLNSLVSLLSEKDVALVMYYAPWDSLSMQTRQEIELVAKFYHNEVYFAAINCWWPEGECSKKYSVSFPLVVVHIHEVGAVRYDGPLIYSYMISFLDSVLSPLVPLHHTGELVDLLTKHEGVLVAFFDFKDGGYPHGYKEFYSSSIRALTADPNRRLCFAVITNRGVASKFKLKSSVHLFQRNSTEAYLDSRITHADLLNWAYSRLRQVTQWVAPLGTKSRGFSQIIEKMPTLILFTPRNLLFDSPYYDLLREVVLDYNNCNESSYVTSIIHRSVLKRHILQEEFSRLIQKCHRNISETHADICKWSQDFCDLTCCQSLDLDLGYYKLCHCRACLHHTVQSVRDMKLFECENTLDLILKNFQLNELKNSQSCNNIEASLPLKFGEFKRLSFKCESETFYPGKSSKLHVTEKTQLEQEDDHILLMMQNNDKQQCQRLRYALNYSELNFPGFPPSENNFWQTNFTGLGCRTNRTLLFIAMDVVLYHAFAENLGIDVSKNFHQTAVLIAEAMQESQYILNDQINKKVLVEFIKNFTDGNLDRHLRMPVRKLPNCVRNGGDLCIEEVTTTTFSEIVLDNNKDVVLMYYASWCGACSSVAHIYLSVADYFSNIKDIKFSRISGEDNDLPWEYTAVKYPTIIFFPAKRKHDSVEFPPHLPITMTNLLHFILVHTQPKVRWYVAMEMCNKECVAHNLIQSSKELRRLFREHHVLLNDLSFVRQVIYEFRKMKSGKKSTLLKLNKDFSINYYRTVYLNYLTDHVKDKRVKIGRALQLQNILRKKRDVYLKTVLSKSEKTKFKDLRQKVAKDEL